MDIRFLPHNTHLEDPSLFHDRDPHLRRLDQQALIHRSRLLEELPADSPGIYSISGGRQIGKTTLLKQWMATLLEKGVAPAAIFYITGEMIDDHHTLVRLISDLLDQMPDAGMRFLMVDEATYITGWDKGVKFLADAGLLEKVVLIVTGSDLTIIKEARMRFPGRRGVADTVDFHLFPLGFGEYVRLSKKLTENDITELIRPEPTAPDDLMNCLYDEFRRYLAHGGFLTAINDLGKHGTILPATFATYSDWIRGDVLKRNKQEHYLREILETIVKHYGSQVTWNALSGDLSIDHPKTISDYVALLESMDAVFVQSALIEDKLTAAPKKARKLMFTDPFIFHASNAWLHPCKDPFHDQLSPALQGDRWPPRLVEACAATHYSRKFPTYYIKAKGEVDIAYVDQNRFWPVEVKWTEQIRPNKIKQIVKYPNGLILTKSGKPSEIQGVPTLPLPLALLRLDPGW